LHYETQLVLVGGSLSNNAQLTERDGHWNIQGDPTEAAFLVAAHKLADTSEGAIAVPLLATQIMVVQVPFLQAAFGTAPLDLAHWGWCVALASTVLWFDEIRKITLRWLAKRRAC